MKTGLVRWEWHSLDHVGAAESEVEAPHGLDALGLLPPQLDRPRARRRPADLGAQHVGRLPAAGRQRHGSSGAWAATTAPSRWGRARRWPGSTTAACCPDGELTFFDDGSNPPIHRQSRGLRITLDLKAHRRAPAVRLHPPRPAAARREPGQHADARRRERARRLRRRAGDQRVRPDGSLLFDAHQPFDMSFYRAFRFPWSGRPPTPPAVARQPQQHRRRDDRARELERRHRRRRLARARRPDAPAR